MTSTCEKNVQQEHGLFTQNKCLSRISSFLKKKIDTGED